MVRKESTAVTLLAINKFPGNDADKVLLFYSLPEEENKGVAIVLKLNGD